MKPRRRLAFVVLPLLVIALAACGGVETAACSLFGYGVEIQADLNELLAIDPALMAQSGTPENAAALDAIDGLEATRAEGQDALDSAAEDVGPVIERAFQAALDATEIGAANLRTAVESGDPAAVTDAMGDVQVAANAIDTFMTALGDSRFECDEAASPSASEGSSASAPASASASASASAPPSDTPTPIADRDAGADSDAHADADARHQRHRPRRVPRRSPRRVRRRVPRRSPRRRRHRAADADADAEPTPSPTPSPTATPSPTPTASPTHRPPSPSPTETASPSAEPSPSPSGESGDQGPGPMPWLAGLVLVAVAGGAIYVWYQNREEAADGVDVTDEGLPPEDQPPGGPPPPPPPTQG